ncbi:hypothetical protein AB0M38_24270 [Streptomyces sp. NPDC051742]|uniref:hypothetical protein n=1 Tax=unclassified Streptomyces TaxID=2593676 RepID=UPI00341C6A14
MTRATRTRGRRRALGTALAVLAQDAAGVLWRYDGNGAGGLKSRVKIGWGWNGLSTF